MIRVEDINAVLARTDGWRNALIASGIPETALKNKHGPCPACGGKDRFRFDNKNGRGTYFCSGCGHGDGFSLLMKVRGISFIEAKDMAAQFAGIVETRKEYLPAPAAPQEPEIARPSYRIKALVKESCSIEDCDAAVDYLDSRCLWPLPKGHLLRAHPSVEYWQDGNSVGRFPALVTPIRNIAGELVTAHVTYLTQKGEKLADYEARKILSPMTGHSGCAARIMSVDDTLGIAEGIETALSAAKLLGIPTWAALNTSLLAKFDVPHGTKTLVIFADRDIPGMEAASKLMTRLQDKVRMQFHLPKAKDFNDVLRAPL